MNTLSVRLRTLLVLWTLCCPAAVALAEHSDTEVRTTVEQVLADPEFRHLHVKSEEPVKDPELPQWVKDFFKWLFGANRIRESSNSSWDLSFNLGNILLSIVVGLLAVGLAYLLVTLFRKLPQAGMHLDRPLVEDLEALAPSTPPGDLPANEYERRAVIAAQSGDYRSAIRELVLGCMSWTERSGLIRYRRGLTNRDYIRAVWRQLRHRESLLTISGTFERVFYGRRVADAAMYEACLSEFRQTFSLEPAHAPLAG